MQTIQQETNDQLRDSLENHSGLDEKLERLMSSFDIIKVKRILYFSFNINYYIENG